VDVADIPVMIIVGHVEGRRAARGSDVATRGGGGATQRHSLSTCHADGAPFLLEEDAATVTKLLDVRLITKGLKIVFCRLLDMKKIKRKSSPWMRPEVEAIMAIPYTG
jgi:hypothetical protein